MRVTTDLLSRLRSLDDLVELTAALGYPSAAEELNYLTRDRIGLHAASRAAILGRRDTLTVYGALVGEASRATVAASCTRLARATVGEHPLLLALDPEHRVLAVAAPLPGERASARVLRLALDPPSRVGAEILSALGPRPADTAVALAVRIADALADEGLTHRFFRQFARAHEAAAAALEQAPRASRQERRDLALVILTRVLFLYFVQTKGWLAGRRDFLPSLLDTALGRGHHFHRAAFEPLCFGALATPWERRSGPARLLGELPFLNGGLFERHSVERRYPAAVLPNDTWRALFDDLFERFHFTCREDGDEDAVDPAMLGRVFEELMGAGRRRASGAYYTPPALLRDIVSRALDAALAGRAASDAAALRVLDPAVGSGSFLLEVLRQLERRTAAAFPDRPATHRRRAILRDSLYGVDSDPMAVRLAELRLWLALVMDDDASWREVAPLPNLDRNLRQGDSLISPLDLAGYNRPEGVRARLLKVAERRTSYFAASGTEKAALARAMRHEERSIALACAEVAIGSLTARLAHGAAAGSRDLFGNRGARSPALERRINQWRRERRELMAVRSRLLNDDVLPFFSYDVHYGDILEAGGFDIVIGNPPWVRGERIPRAQRELLGRRYSTWKVETGGGFAHIPDLSVAFVERALELVRTGGIVAMLVPAKLLRSGYAGALRAFLRRKATVLALDDLSHSSEHGFGATVFPLALVLRRRDPAPHDHCQVTVRAAAAETIRGRARQDELSLDASPSRAPWLALPGWAVRAVREALRAGPRLGSLFRPKLGIKTGANEIFVRALGRAEELPAAGRVPAIHGADIEPFAARPAGVVLAALDREGNALASVEATITAYLAPFERRLARRTDANGGPPWTVFRTDLVRLGWLVLWRDIALQLEACALERRAPGDPVPLNTCYGVVVPDAFTAAWLTALLNSMPLRTIAAVLADRASGGAYRFNAGVVGALPVPAHRTASEVRSLARLGQAALAGKPWSNDELNTLAIRALGLRPAVAGALRDLAATVRRNAGRNR